jgi:hypothetical protein|tara:strand:+ start:3715 stop:3927 length:213 start_codon:yes stop_codon:yes gene_type:complete
MSKGYEQFKKVDKELDALLLYLEKLEEDYLRAESNLQKYKEGFDILHDYFDSFPEDVKRDVDKQLMKLDL